MKQHYGINDAEWEQLTKHVSTLEMIQSVSLFDPQESGEPITKVGLMHYIDRHGDFTEGTSSHSRIARAVFNSLPANEKAEIFRYFEIIEDVEQ